MNPSAMFSDRVERLKAIGMKSKIEAFLVTSENNLRYFAGFSALAIERFAGMVIPVGAGEPIVIVPRLEEGKAKERSAFERIKAYADSESPAMLLKKVIKELNLEKAVLGVEGTLQFKFYNILVESSRKIKVKDASTVFSQLRSIKSEEELKKMEKAANIVAKGITAGIEFIKSGVSELMISSAIERTIKENGGESIPFCLVLSGSNSALPHGETSTRKISGKDVVLMDVGAVYQGYYADLTRTVFVGEAPKKQREIYDVVAKAQETAIKNVKPSVKAEEIDSAARAVIEDAGYGRYFTHRTGHGLGLEVHEEPYIVQGNKALLKPGMTFTVEPGIYLAGKFGVRIEDNVAVSRTKTRMLSDLSKELLIL